MEWTEEKTLTLIDTYHEQPVLWNTRLREYKNRNKRHDALKKICEKIGPDKEEIEKKVRYLLNHFALELKTEKNSAKSGTSTENTYKSKWFVFKSMLFLKDNNKPAPTVDTEGTHEQAGSQNSEVEETEDSENERSQNELQRTKVFKSPKKQALKRKQTNMNTPIVNEVLNLMRSVSSKKVERDEFSLYNEQVAIKLRKTSSPYAKFTIKNIINNALFDGEMGRYDRPLPQTTQYHTPSTFGGNTLPNSSSHYSRSTPSPYNDSFLYESDISSENVPGHYD